jgi:hypothetical protein
MVLATSQQEFSDADHRIVAKGDQSKKLAWDVSGIATGTTRTISVPNADMAFSAAFASFVNSPSSANFASLLTDESGTAGTVPFQQTGTWTPSFAATGATFSYSVRSGNYLKIGNMVFVDGLILLNTSGNTLTANPLSITGLPFTPTASTAGQYLTIAWFAATSSYVFMLGGVSGGTTTVAILGINGAGASFLGSSVNANTGLHATNGSAFRFGGVYLV